MSSVLSFSRRVTPFLLAGLAAVSCKTPNADYQVKEGETGSGGAEAALGALGVTFDQVGEVQLDVENDTAFWRKVAAVKEATRSVDLAYFLYGADYAGSYLGKLLLDKATGPSPVKVRMMVDAKTAASHKAFFQMLVAKGKGNLEVHYFRPMPKVVQQDFQRLGLDPQKFVGALLKMDAAGLTAQVKQSNIVAANPDVLVDLQKLIAVLTLKQSAAAASAPGIPGNAIGSAALDVMIAAQVAQTVQSLRASAASLGLQATGKDWFDLTKWTHHKLLVVDGQDMIGGGRNLEDAYHWEKDHVIRRRENIKKYVFMDVDFHVTSSTLATKAITTFDGYLDADCYVEPPVPESCETQIPMARETAASPADADAAYAKMVAKAEELGRERNYARTYEPVHKGKFSVASARIAYAENRMFPDDASDATLLTEEPSQHNAALVALIDATPAGQDVVVQNAYVYFPGGLHVALMRALKRGVNVMVISNSPESSDLGFVAQAARLQYEPFLRMSAQTPGKFSVFEYMTEESLHTKVTIIGDRYLALGSINADPRCEFLDTNNGVIIDSPDLTSRYKSWLMALKDSLMNSRTRTITAADGSTREIPMMRQVDLARIAQEDAKPTTDKILLYHRSLKPMAAASFLETEAGATARAQLQSLFIQY